MSLLLQTPPLPPPRVSSSLHPNHRHSPSAPAAAAATTSSTSTTTPSTATNRPAPPVGLGNNTGDYQGLVMTLKNESKYSVPSVVVARVTRLDWLRNAAGLLDSNYWKGTLRPTPVLDWYLQRVEDAVSQAKLLSPPSAGGTISLIGHSAGGWLARVYMDQLDHRSHHISLLLTLGSPHLPPPKGVPGVIDQTRGLLDYVEKNCAPAVYTPELKYVCIAGRYIQGVPLVGNPDVTSAMVPLDKDRGMVESSANDSINKPASFAPTLRARFIGQGYKQVCGRADVWGDGVVPEMSAHLEGALNISLEGVYHSPVGSDDTQRPWYGSPAVAEKWVHHLLY